MDTFEDFQKSLTNETPPKLNGLLLSLWWAGKGAWNKSHAIAQDIPSADGAWIHAYLHRAEGSVGNAGYWYARAGQPNHTGSAQEEWEELVKHFLDS